MKIPKLTEALREIFSTFGDVVEIVAKRNIKAKGQAFIVFESAEEAGEAIEELQGFDLFDRPMQLAFAKTRSDAIVLREDGEDGLERHKKHRLAEKGQNISYAIKKSDRLTLCRAQASIGSSKRETDQACSS